MQLMYFSLLLPKYMKRLPYSFNTTIRLSSDVSETAAEWQTMQTLIKQFELVCTLFVQASYIPADIMCIQHHINVDFASTYIQRCLNVACPLGLDIWYMIFMILFLWQNKIFTSGYLPLSDMWNINETDNLDNICFKWYLVRLFNL